MRPAGSMGFALAAIILVAACETPATLAEDRNVDCTDELRWSIVVQVEDAASGESLRGATVVVRDGAFQATLPISPSGYYGFEEGERPGTYDITITRHDYTAWARDDVVVTADECHVQTQEITAELQPIGS